MGTTRVITIIWLLFSTTECEAVFVAGTSFENEAVVGAVYIDSGDPLMDHDLVNNSGQRLVNSTESSTTAGDLGFHASYENTRQSVGLADGDAVGVTDVLDVVDAFTHGSQGYRLSDPDGLMRLTFDPVDIAGLGDVDFSLDYLIQASQWSSGDSISIFVDVDGEATDPLSFSGVGIRDIDHEEWVQLSRTVSGNTATLVVELDSDAPNESLFIDNVAFNASSTAVPEPSALLFCTIVLGGMAAGHCIKSRSAKSAGPGSAKPNRDRVG